MALDFADTTTNLRLKLFSQMLDAISTATDVRDLHGALIGKVSNPLIIESLVFGGTTKQKVFRTAVRGVGREYLSARAVSSPKSLPGLYRPCCQRFRFLQMILCLLNSLITTR